MSMRDYMINCNENKNDNGKINHINKTWIGQVANIEINIQKYSVSR